MSATRRRFIRGPEKESAPGVEVADFSLLPRTGYKGAGTVAWLQSRGFELRPEPNRAFDQADGSLVAMLSKSEALILGPMAEGLDAAGRCYSLPRRDSHYWFLLTGVAIPELFSKLCGVDLRPVSFANGSVAQTLVARTSAIIIRNQLDYHLLGDSASATYVWSILAAQVRELGDHVRR